MKHITDTEIRRFHAHTLSSEEEMLLFDHTAKCDFCAGRLFSALPERELLTPPPDLGRDILETAKKIPFRKQKQREFFRYSTKVVLAMGMALSLLLVFSLPGNNSLHFPINSIFQGEQPWVSEPIISSEKQAYLETLEKQEKKKKENQKQKEKFLQEKKAQNEKWKEKEKNSGKISGGLRNFSSGILSYFKSEQETTDIPEQ